MIQEQTILNIADNSGAKKVKCIKILGGFKKRVAKQGDVVVISVQELKNQLRQVSKVKKGSVHKALILRTKYKQIKKDGSCVFFDTNSASLINNQGKPLASRITGPLLKTFKKGKFSKFSSISPGLIN